MFFLLRANCKSKIVSVYIPSRYPWRRPSAPRWTGRIIIHALHDNSTILRLVHMLVPILAAQHISGNKLRTTGVGFSCDSDAGSRIEWYYNDLAGRDIVDRVRGAHYVHRRPKNKRNSIKGLSCDRVYNAFAVIGYVTDRPAAEFVAAARPSNV